MTCRHPRPELCRQLGFHLYGAHFQRYVEDDRFRTWIEKESQRRRGGGGGAGLVETREEPTCGGGPAEHNAAIFRFKNPCVHFGPATGRTLACCGSPPTYVCALHGECTRSPNRLGVRSCMDPCPDYQAPPRKEDGVPRGMATEVPLDCGKQDQEELSPGMCLKCMIRAINGPMRQWPAGWASWPVTDRAHAQELDRLARLPLPCPDDFQGRGIVICAGGWRFFPSLYVSVRMIRSLGCNLPIQVWYIDESEFDNKMAGVLEDHGVGWINAQAFARDRGLRLPFPLRHWHGWALKPLAVMHSPFREVLYLDADCYPVRNPEFLFDDPRVVEQGAYFTPDSPGQKLLGLQFSRLGIPVHDEPAFESGQFLVDKGRCWKELVLTTWLCQHSDWTWAGNGGLGLYGDKDCFHLAWRKTGRGWAFAPDPNGAHVRRRWHSFVQHDLDHQPLFVHRTRDKFRWNADPNTGEERPDPYSTHQHFGVFPIFNRRLPEEAEAHRYFKEVTQLFFADKRLGMTFRPETMDRHIWLWVNCMNEYRLPPAFKEDDAILDLGAHIGAFSWACLRRGSRQVHAVECDPENLILLRRNLSDHQTHVTIYGEAAWRNDAHDCPPPTYSVENAHNTGAGSLLRHRDGVPVRTVRFDDLVLAATDIGRRRLRLCKLDIEGAEFPCLLTSGTLHLIDELVGEYHPVQQIPSCARLDGYSEFTADCLRQHLEKRGFSVQLKPSANGLGRFWARRAT